VTTRKPKAKTPSRRSTSARTRTRRTDDTEAPATEVPPQAAEAAPADEELYLTAAPEFHFAQRVPPTAPPRPLPDTRRGIFFDVENTSRPEHVARVLQHLSIDWTAQATDLTAVGNWRVIGHETARILAQRGAQLVHSAPSVGVRDWSDLRIAVAAGVWLAAARPGDTIVIVSDDQAFDAVGDVAASLGVRFQRLSYRALAGLRAELPVEETPAEARPRRRSRGGRGRRTWPRSASAGAPASQPPAPPVESHAPAAEPHTAPHDELLAVVRELVATAPGGVNLDNLSNALKARGFARPPGSPRLITRLRRIKELEIGRNGSIRLVESNGDVTLPEPAADADAGPAEGAWAPEAAGGEGEEPTEPAGEPASGAPRRRRRRGGRRRRGRGRTGSAASAPAPDVPI
jgi:hypothetical protein